MKLTENISPNHQILINKEIYGQESQRFLNNFLKISAKNSSRTHTPIRRLYRVTGTIESPRFIQVLPNFSELNRKNYFVLESGSEIFLYHPEKTYRGSIISNRHYSAAFDFGHLIMKIGGKNTNLKYTYVDSPRFSNDKFFKLLNGAPEEKTRNNIPENNNTESISGCYVLEKSHVNEAVLYIGQRADSNQISHILNYGEHLASQGGKTVSISPKKNPLIHFVIAFEDLNNVLSERDFLKKQKILKDLLP